MKGDDFTMNLQYVQGKPMFNQVSTMQTQYPYLTQDIETEVIIIGGGVTGSLLAYYFSKANIKTVMLEKSRVAHGSTSVTTALLQYELDDNARELQMVTSLENVITSYRLGLKALNEIDQFIQEYGNACDYERKDTLLYTSKEQEVPSLYEEYRVRKEAGLDVEFLTETHHPFSFDLKAGVYGVNGGAQLNPFLFTHQLLDQAILKGLKVYENTEAKTLNFTEDGVEVTTMYGHVVKGKKVVIATGYSTDSFTKRHFGEKTVSYNIVTKPLEAFTGWEKTVLIRDNEDPYHYFRTTSDGRIIAGGEDIPFVPGIFKEKEAQKRYRRLEERVQNMFPSLTGIETDFAYAGAFASTSDNLGFIGPDPKHHHLWYCLGYGANGILFAVLGGLFLTELYQGKRNEHLKLFEVNRFDK